MRLAVVILNWNGEGFLRRFLPGVVEYSTGVHAPEGCDVTVVVADNASTDNSLRWLSDTYGEVGDSRVRILAFDRNYGFTGGYNRALATPVLADYDYFLLLNSDVEVTPGWLIPLVGVMGSDSTIGAAMPKLRSFDRREYFEYAGASGGFIDALGYPFCRGRIFGTVEKDEGQYDTVRDIFWATGAAMLVRATLWRELCGLDEDFFAHMEEIDFCWRLHRRGYRVVVCPGSVVYHVGGGALPASSPRKTYFNFRNNLAMLYKNRRLPVFVGVYLLRFGIDFLQAFGYLLTGKPAFAGAVVRGHRDFWFRMRCRLDRHKEYGFRMPKGSRQGGIYRGFIVLRYLLGSRTFGKKM